MNNYIKAFCDLECVKNIPWIIMVLLCCIGVFGINFGIFHDASKALLYCVIEIISLGILFFLCLGLVFCILDARHEFLSKKAKLDLLDHVKEEKEEEKEEEVIIV
jgi:vacuolar-type H+-ATPase subunit I/STV1